ncbi:MAG: 6-phosphofructokinase [bacterium]
MKKIGILTSGGDCGGLNAVVKGAAQMANSLGIESVIIPNGYAGLYNLVNFDKLVTLTPSRLDRFEAYPAGSEAGHSRVKIKKIKDPAKYERIRDGLQRFSIDALVISGGDDTGSVLVDLSEKGIPCIHAPKTMDLDLQSYSVGGDSTINRISRFVQDLKTTGRTHNRIIVTEVFGRYAGHTAFRGGVAAEADAILIPEIPVDFDILYQHLFVTFTRRIRENDAKAGTYTVVVAEGMTDASGREIVDESAGVDAFGHKKLAGAGKYVCQELEKRLKADLRIRTFMKETGQFVEELYEIPEVRSVRPGHLVRAGESSSYDVNFGKEAGAGAVLLLKQGITGVTICRINGKSILYQKTEDVIKQRHVNLDMVALYETMGFCFGRNPVPYQGEAVEVTGSIDRIY